MGGLTVRDRRAPIVLAGQQVTFFLDGIPMPMPADENPAWGVDGTYAPRRTVLDRILVQGALDHGVEIRERFSVTDLVIDDGVVTGIRGREAGGREVTERASIVIGADGKNSLVARLVQAAKYNVHPPADCGFYGYWSGIDMDRCELHSQADVGGALAAPTNDGMVCMNTFDGPDRGGAAVGHLTELSRAWSRRVEAMGYTRHATTGGDLSPREPRKPS